MRTKYSLYLDENTKMALDARAALEGKTTSDLVRMFVAFGLGMPCTGQEDIHVTQQSVA